MSTGIGYNVAAIYLDAVTKAHTLVDRQLNDKLNELTAINELLRHLHTVQAKLSHAQEDEGDFSHDEAFITAHAAICSKHPHVFGDVSSLTFTRDDRELCLRQLENAVRMEVTEVNRLTAEIHQHNEDKIQYTESGSKTLQMLIEHIKAIISRYRGG